MADTLPVFAGLWVLEAQRVPYRGRGDPIWYHPLIIPAYLAAGSVLLVLSRMVLSVLREDAGAEDNTGASDTRRRSSLFRVPLDVYIQKIGGTTIFAFRLSRVLSIAILAGLSIVTFVRNEEPAEPWRLNDLGQQRMNMRNCREQSDNGVIFRQDWLQLIQAITHLYTFVLSLSSMSATPKEATTAATHMNIILVAGFAIYAYRDVWPLATYTLTPADRCDDILLWEKIAVLFAASVAIPLATPRKYTPYNPKEPSSEINPEQTASILSLAIYTFLDPIIWAAGRVPHLSHEQLPPIADYDLAKNLIGRSFKHLDVFSGSPSRHLFFGLIKVFRYEYITMAAMVVIKVLSGFLGPIGINRLLSYLEGHGEDAVVRPWVWISSLLFGPLIGGVAFQWYLFNGTGMIVRVQGIITQLVFEHSLRVRMKAETSEPDNKYTRGPSPDGSPDDAASVARSENGSDETVQASTSNGKGKQKAEDPQTKPATASAPEKSNNLVGKINNLVSTDLSNITNPGVDFLEIVLWMPLELALCIWFLYTILGWSAFVGMAVMIMLLAVPGKIAQAIQSIQQEAMKKTDARVQTVTETMGILRMIKLFGWEAKTDEMLDKKRQAELTFIRKRQVLNLVNRNVYHIIPIATMVVTFATYTGIMKRTLMPSAVFSSMAVFDLMRNQLRFMFYMVPGFIQAKVSLDRINEFLHKTELLDEFVEPRSNDAHTILEIPHLDENIIGFQTASFTWSNEKPEGSATPSKRRFVLRIDDKLVFKRGCFNLIVGPTGSGKTSLLMAILGEMHFVPLGPGSWFNLPRKNGVAYAAQESWVQNETIRDNILFGSPYDEVRYEKVIYQCGLKRDLSLFEAGDKTEVGERGLTLSGGQKARVTLARAIYSPAETILLDDNLAALDVHTARWVVEKCFKGDLLQGRTVLLVTHNVAMASPIAEYVVSLRGDGTIANYGSVSDVLEKDKTLSAQLATDIEESERDDKEIDSESPDAIAKQADGKLIVAEEVAMGHVGWEPLKLFFTSLGGSHVPLFWVVFLGAVVLSDMGMSVQTWWMGHWAGQYDIIRDPSEVDITFYLSIYCLILLIAITLYTIGNGVYVFGTFRASKIIHRQLIQSILGTTLRWLDTTPASRVIARCTHDVHALDGSFAAGFSSLVEKSATMLIKLAAVVVLTPVFVFPGILALVLGGWCGQIYMRAQIAVKREMSNARAPVLGHFGAAIVGLTSIRAYGAQAAFRAESYRLIDHYTRVGRTFYNLNRWVNLRVDSLGGLFASGLAAWLIYGPGHKGALPSDTGFSLTMAVGFSGMILWWIRTFNSFEIDGNSLERIQAYIKIEQEPKATKEGDPPAYWPASGDLRVENLSARYSEDGPKVLHDLSFHIKSGERIGVVGRTGSGKSSLTLALLRSIFTEGEVYYDGLLTGSINLNALRSNITVIPQMPELLSGTLRGNLDPFSQHDDAALNAALRASGLFSLRTDDSGRLTLDSVVSGGGGNLSVGQRQIIALARAIVRDSKLLILDEATSAIDYETDAVIQASLRNEMKRDVTLITVAHRLQTIMDVDRIMVLDAGRIVEFDTPVELLRREGGRLRALVDESGDRDALYKMAARHATESTL